MWETFWQDLRYGARILLRQPGVSSIAVLALALGIGANAPVTQLNLLILIQGQNMSDCNFLCLGVHDHFLHQQAHDLSSFFKTQIGQIYIHPFREISKMLDQL